MTSRVIKECFTLGELDKREIFRYTQGTDEKLLDTCLAEIGDISRGLVVSCELDVRVEGDECFFGSFSLVSHDLAKNLDGCERAIIFAATVGVEYDRLIMKYSRLSPSKALFFQAIGSERVEALCDAFVKKAGENRVLRPRFSAGYGDLPLDTQREIFALLDPAKHIGVALNASLLMTPSKSVTAFVGIGAKE